MMVLDAGYVWARKDVLKQTDSSEFAKTAVEEPCKIGDGNRTNRGKIWGKYGENGIQWTRSSHRLPYCRSLNNCSSMLQQLQHQEIKKGVAEEFMSLRSSAKHKARFQLWLQLLLLLLLHKSETPKSPVCQSKGSCGLGFLRNVPSSDLSFQRSRRFQFVPSFSVIKFKMKDMKDDFIHFPFTFHSLSIHFPFTFHSLSIHFPFTFHSLSIHFPFTFHSLSIHFPFTFHSLSIHFPFTFHSLSIHFPLTL